jgi:hypothetical protein
LFSQNKIMSRDNLRVSQNPWSVRCVVNLKLYNISCLSVLCL